MKLRAEPRAAAARAMLACAAASLVCCSTPPDRAEPTPRALSSPRAALASAGAPTQDAATDRPRIGLVLSGGGARGAAHVGVLQVLEDLRVPIDVVVGTSMGAVVGGLYAAGYSPDELRRVVEEADWPALLGDGVPRAETWYRRRQDAREFQVDVELGWKDGGIALPPGLVQGRNIVSFLEGLTLPVAGIDDFDELAVPFRCVATDLADGSAVVFEDGSLVEAIRASMSLPGIFAPVTRDGRVLVDGGVVDNIPVDVARELGADVVIVVDISTPLGDVETLRSPFGISNQVLSILMATNRERALGLVGEEDVTIQPNLEGISTLGFERASDAVALGRSAAAALRERLAKLGVDGATWTDYVTGQRRDTDTSFRVRDLIVESDGPLSPEVIRRYARVEEGQTLDAEGVRHVQERLSGLGAFEEVGIEVRPVPGAAGTADVVVRPVEKSWGPNFLRFGLDVSTNLTGDGEFGVGLQHTSRPLNALGGEWRNEVELGTSTRLSTGFYQPLDPGLRWFLEPSVTFEQDDLVVRVDGQALAEVSVEALSAELDLGRNLGSWGEARIGYGYGTGTARPEIALPGLIPSSTNIDAETWSARLSVDTLDSIAFPRTGLVGHVEWEQRGVSAVGGERKGVVDAVLGAPITSGPWTAFGSIEGGTTVEGEGDVSSEFRLGGFRRLSGLAPGEVEGKHYALAVVEPYLRLGDRSSAFGVAKFVGASLEVGALWDERRELRSEDVLVGGSIYVGAETLLGPAFLGLGLTEGGERSLYVFIGPTF